MATHAPARVLRERKALSRLEQDGLIQREGGGFRTTRRWQAAMARAASQLYRQGDDTADLRLPIIRALLEIYGPGEPAWRVVDLTEAMLPIERNELSPRA